MCIYAWPVGTDNVVKARGKGGDCMQEDKGGNWETSVMVSTIKRAIFIHAEGGLGHVGPCSSRDSIDTVLALVCGGP